MKVLLLAKPPMGDKVAAELRMLGVDLDYQRDLSSHAMAGAVHPGFAWVLAMNSEGQGAALKERARRIGARFASIPPSWSFAEKSLRENHFFTDLAVEKERASRGLPVVLTSRQTAPPVLTHRPFEHIRDEPPQDADADGHSDPAPVEPEPVAVQPEPAPPLPPPPPPAPPKGDPMPPSAAQLARREEKLKFAESKFRKLPNTTFRDMQEFVVAEFGDGIDTGAMGVIREKVREELAGNNGHVDASAIAEAAEDFVPNSASRKALEKKKYAVRLFDATPHLSVEEANRQIRREFGGGTTTDELYAIRRERAKVNGVTLKGGIKHRVGGVSSERVARAARLASNGVTKHMPEYRPSAEPLPTAEGEFPSPVAAAIDLLVKEMIAAGMIGTISTADTGVCSFEGEMRRKFSIKAKV